MSVLLMVSSLLTIVMSKIPLQSHYHPAVSLHAHQLLTHSLVTATPDLGLNTLSHFLDRFVYKNAKKKTTQKGTSAMQRAGIESEAKTNAEVEVNTDQFKNMKKKDVPVDQVMIFFHNYINTISSLAPRTYSPTNNPRRSSFIISLLLSMIER